MRRKKRQEQPSPATGDGRITPRDVQQVEFRLAFRGYNERDVDAFLDRVTEDLAAYQDELERLRRSVGAAAIPVEAAEAAEIVARAREEAAAIVRRAEQEAETIRAAARGAAGDARAAVAPFLSREREFLQSLGSLVQSHANEIREMVQAVRSTEAAAAEANPADEGRPSGEAPEPSPEPETVRDEPPPAGPLEEPVVVERAGEPAFRSESAPAEGRERSLRELFWGED